MIVFFDGDCLLCSRGVRWLHWLDPRDRLRFASLQGETARPFKDILPALHEGDDTMATLVREKKGGREVHTHSDAIVRALRASGGFSAFLGLLLRIIPRFLRDGAYRWIAGKRFHFFGKADACQLLRPDLKSKLLD